MGCKICQGLVTSADSLIDLKVQLTVSIGKLMLVEFSIKTAEIDVKKNIQPLFVIHFTKYNKYFGYLEYFS